MTRATRTLSVVGAMVILGGIGLGLADSADGSAQLVSGTLAPLDTSRTEGWMELARLSTEELGPGRIRAIDLVGDSLYVLQASAWSVVVAGQLEGNYGTAVTGAPGYLARAEGIVRTATGVAVLDAARRRITMWSPSGERLVDRELEQRAGEVALHQALVASVDGLLLTSWVSTDSGGHWLIQRLGESATERLPRLPGQRTGDSYNVPHLLPRDDGSLVVVEADSWRIRRYGSSLALEGTASRSDAPHFRIPGPLARRMRERVAMMPETQRRDFLLAESLPSLRSATMTAEGELLVLTVFDEASTIAELIGSDGRPIATLWARPDSSSMFAVRGSVLRVREMDNHTIIERLLLRPND